DKSWICAAEKATNWNKMDFDAASWVSASELGDASLATWKLEDKIVQGLAASSLNGRVRSALVAADPLAVALGRPNREQVITSRASAATTLQALELTNGQVLTTMLHQGAANLVGEAKETSGRKFAEDVYVKALGRKPTAAELK